MLFNLVNSKALPIISERSLSVLMRDEGAAGGRFDEDPEVYLTHWSRDRIRGWPMGFYEAMGTTPLTRLRTIARVLIRPGGITDANYTQMDEEVRALFDPLYEITVRLRNNHEAFVLSSAFLPVAAEVYARHTLLNDPTSNSRQERCLRAERWLLDFAVRFDRICGADLPLPADPSLLWAIFKRDYEKRARWVFIAMSFRNDQTLKDVGLAIREAI
jgi:hypothetical protein